jgi:hypothetical protein
LAGGASAEVAAGTGSPPSEGGLSHRGLAFFFRSAALRAELAVSRLKIWLLEDELRTYAKKLAVQHDYAEPELFAEVIVRWARGEILRWNDPKTPVRDPDVLRAELERLDPNSRASWLTTAVNAALLKDRVLLTMALDRVRLAGGYFENHHRGLFGPHPAWDVVRPTNGKPPDLRHFDVQVPRMLQSLPKVKIPVQGGEIEEELPPMFSDAELRAATFGRLPDEGREVQIRRYIRQLFAEGNKSERERRSAASAANRAERDQRLWESKDWKASKAALYVGIKSVRHLRRLRRQLGL